jgi:hypothetical protein
VQKEKGEGGLYIQHGLREIEGEFVTLYKELIDDEVKFYGHFRMNRECFSALLEEVSPL